MKNALLFFCILVQPFFFAQQFEGRVTNIDTVPLAGVSVFLNETLKSRTDEKGFFTLDKVQNTDTLQFRYRANSVKISVQDFTTGKNTIVVKDYQEIETVNINLNDYDLHKYDYGLKQETNSRFIVAPGFEMAFKVKNTQKRKGIISQVSLFLHKTERNLEIAPVEIIFYAIDSLTGKPGSRLNENPVVYHPNSKSRRKVNVKVKDY